MIRRTRRARLTLTFLCAHCHTLHPDPPAYVVGPAPLAEVPRSLFFGRACTRIGQAVVCGPAGRLSATETTRFGALESFAVFTPLLRFCSSPCLRDWIDALQQSPIPSVH